MSMDASDGRYPGIDRTQYFLSRLGMIAVAIAAVFLFGPDSQVVRILSLVLLIVSLALDVLRLQNIGLTMWLALIRFLPFGNLILDIGLQSAQPGWAESRRLDDTGKRILIVNVVFLAILLLLAMRAGVALPMYL